MDILTQGVIGAVTAQSIAKKKEIRSASVVGFIAGLLADADVLIRSNSDPLLTLEYHRHFTHSIFFIPVGALIAFLILWPCFRKRLPNKNLYFYCLAGYMFSGFIDTCTSYGTYYLWPLINERIAWHIIAIIDPVFTGILVVCLVIGLKAEKPIAARTGLSLAGLYLLLGVIQLQRAESFIEGVAIERGHTIERLMVKPTIANNILWRSIYLADGNFYIDAVRAGWSGKLFEGDSVRLFNLERDMPLLGTNTLLAQDIKRFEYFSDNYVSFYPGKEYILGDVRYAMSPVSTIPLWGIEMDLNRPEQHVKYNFYRDSSKESKQRFMDMLFNRY
ncbi:MAG: metal-dependent hydrolase [Proteobacteria bacterium]|nr:metal-dependent hydrolase [Pseudomonadota bacterium]NOG59983.1 metal-dependent hydrolase [Pseudomonadota bacterium]